MSYQGLFDFSPPEAPRARARRSDPATSFAAAESVSRIRESQQIILSLLRTFGPHYDEQLIELVTLHSPIPMSPSGVRTRRAELVDKGLVRDSRQRARTASGRQTIVWEAAEG